MKIIKRNGSEAAFDITKIIVAVSKANKEIDERQRLTNEQIRTIAANVEGACVAMGRAASVEEIQDLVEKQIMAHGAFEVAKDYITLPLYAFPCRAAPTPPMTRFSALSSATTRKPSRKTRIKTRSSTRTQRDYMAGEVSRDITDRILLPADIVEAHERGHHPFP